MPSIKSGLGNPFALMQRPYMRSMMGLANRGLQAVTSLESSAETAQSLVFHMMGAEFDSCSAPAYAVVSDISRGPTRSIAHSDLLTNREKTRKISEKLMEGNWVAVTLSPDHTFVVIPVGGHQVVIQQAYQGCYDLAQWNRFRGHERLMKRYFISLLDDLQDGGEVGKEAAIRLFSYYSMNGDRTCQVVGEAYRNGGSIRYINYGLV